MAAILQKDPASGAVSTSIGTGHEYVDLQVLPA